MNLRPIAPLQDNLLGGCYTALPRQRPKTFSSRKKVIANTFPRFFFFLHLLSFYVFQVASRVENEGKTIQALDVSQDGQHLV